MLQETNGATEKGNHNPCRSHRTSPKKKLSAENLKNVDQREPRRGEMSYDVHSELISSETLSNFDRRIPELAHIK